MTKLFTILFSKSLSPIRLAWYVAMFFLFTNLDCLGGMDCALSGMLLKFFGGILSAAIMFIGIFFGAMEGKSIIKGWLFLKKLKRLLDPIATTANAKISTHWVKSSWYHYYSFEDGNCITLIGWENEFNVFTPHWNPSFEKNTPNYNALINTIYAYQRK